MSVVHLKGTAGLNVVHSPAMQDNKFCIFLVLKACMQSTYVDDIRHTLCIVAAGRCAMEFEC
jgi:hypothetical protein